MPSEQTRTRAVATLLLIGVWGIIVLGIELTHPVVTLEYTAGAEFRYIITALVFTIVGRMWGVEVDHIIASLPGQSSSSDSRQQQARHPDQQRDVTAEYGSPGEREQATEDYPDD